ncbi:RibD family protein [Lichenihabitans sp. Uapishka_5]|uniref:RibD family protein n=1 Tax=Lichenihabitans sp. Uapishka_5 TaxID=3037302 RepID=UPI0029E81B5C|nr:RibD family protein [Lichenihabitans sp. Uapishka_5]MDX7952405.1 RibD family protein [Lichenihabitans sp. Uapishka_5]
MASDSSRPTVAVHMATSLDGRIQTRRWGGAGIGSLYEQVHGELAGDAWMCGRITMQGYTRGTPDDDHDPTPVPRTDHIAKRDASGYAIALDARGALHWGARNAIDDDHVVVVLCETVSDRHLNALRASGVSYLFGGVATIDFARVLRSLKAAFGIDRLLVEGGGGLNGSMLAARLVDEISLLLAPAIDGGRGVPALFDHGQPGDPPPAPGTIVALRRCEALEGGFVRLHYDVSYGTA